MLTALAPLHDLFGTGGVLPPDARSAYFGLGAHAAGLVVAAAALLAWPLAAHAAGLARPDCPGAASVADSGSAGAQPDASASGESAGA